MHTRVIVVTLSVCLSVTLCDFGEGAVFRIETYMCNVTLLKIEDILEKKRVELRP